MTGASACLAKAICTNCMGSSDDFIKKSIVKTNLENYSLQGHLDNWFFPGYCHAALKIQGEIYQNTRLTILSDLCIDVTLNHEFLQHHESLEKSLLVMLNPFLCYAALPCLKFLYFFSLVLLH